MHTYPTQLPKGRAGLWRRTEDSAVKCECGKVLVRGLHRYGVERKGARLAGLPPIQWDEALYCSLRCRNEYETAVAS